MIRRVSWLAALSCCWAVLLACAGGRFRRLEEARAERWRRGRKGGRNASL